MKKITKVVSIICLAIILCLSAISPFTIKSHAAVEPRWSSLNTINASFSAMDSKGYVEVEYTANSTNFEKAYVHVKLQKKFLLFFWTDVNEWSITTTEDSGIISHVFSLDGTGTYKATFTVDVTGTDGTIDTYTTEKESKYSN